MPSSTKPTRALVDASHAIGKKTKIINAQGRCLVPGLLDGHMHVESGMVTVTEFVRAEAVRSWSRMTR